MEENQDPIAYIIRDKKGSYRGTVRYSSDQYYSDEFEFATYGKTQEESHKQAKEWMLEASKYGYSFLEHSENVRAKGRTTEQINQEILDEIMLLKSKLERIEARIQKEGGIKQRYYGEISTAKLNLLLGQASLRYEEERIEGKVKRGKES